ncbi:carbohydrate-binding domain-containing protein [Alloprevotella sp. OH1205_COT-284]|uniref:carbohydrate-binding domain-containing protein n=1 Tax=Alloprevotella sp. OH1205_COT-284 TaxID=2491043 RepID=UPI000F5EDDDB|nr:carbohydrate-binding domain-containing protein [Alloprevotella sp. OH1205_COT-284]RRD79800.1 carbohydrate-binding domain-containing protein [Alloprevotella sp. OH1205_COT-284]
MKSNLLRNTYAAAVALFIALFSVSLATRAENYDLEVAGIRVTSQNCNNIAGDPKNFSENTLGRIRPRAGGYVKYVPHSKTLYIKDTNIVGIGETGFSYAIRSAIEGLTILVEGTNSISSQTEGDLGVVLNKKCTLTGGGTLDVTIWDNADFILAAPVTIQNCTIIANNTQNAFYGYGSSLTVRGAKMVVKGEMSGFDLILRGSKLITPSGVSWNAEKKAMCNAAGQLVYDAVITIERDVKNYGLTIAETTVTSTNCDLISDFSGVSGTVSYDPATKTLYLKNAEISTYSEEADAIYSEIEDLNIQVEGNCTVKAAFSGQDDDCEGIAALGSLKILGNGTLNINSETYGIYIYNDKKLTIDNCTVKVKGTSYGIRGGNNTTLLIINSDVTAEGSLSSVSNINNFSTIGCGIRVPQGAKYDKDNNAVCDASGNIVTSPVHIKPSVKYGLTIADVPVTEDNCNDLSVIPGVKGTAKYDPSAKTLTLNNAEIISNEADASAVSSKIEGLIIKLEGINTLKATDGDVAGLSVDNSCTITGTGTLNAEGITTGIFLDKDLTIDGCTLNLKGNYGFLGTSSQKEEKLTVKNATLTIENSEDGAISDLSALILDGCKIVEPAGAVFNAEKRALCDASGNIIKSKVVIAPTVKYGLYINDVEVDELNCNDLSVIPGVKGTVKYAPSTKTLTLNNAEIISGEDTDDAISTSVENLRIRLEGTNTLRASDDGIETTKSMTVFGSGTLNIESSYGIYLSGSLTVENGTINIKATNYGIYGDEEYLDNNKLTVKNATLTIENSEDGAICQLSALTLDGCKIAEPAGAVFNAEKHALCDADGNIIKSKVVIRNTLTAIDGIGIGNQHHRSGIYTLDGRRLDTPFRHLPKGIYVVDGRKVVKH